MRRALIVPMAIACGMFVFAAAVITALVLVLSPTGSNHASASPRPSPTASPRPSPTAAPEDDEDEDAGWQRGAPGSAELMRLTGQIRSELAAAATTAGAGPGGVEAAGGFAYFGIVYGETTATDVYYVVAQAWQQAHLWTRRGRDVWRYRGGYDISVCDPPVPARLYALWGLSFATPPVQGRPTCAPATSG